MSDTHIVARDQLRAFIERIERLEEEKKTLADDIKDVYGEAKSMGFDTKILRKVISIRKQDTDERLEQEAILATYLSALGMIQMDMFEEPETETSPQLVATVATAMQTQAGRAALLTAVDIMIEREERFDAETGEILDDRPRSDGGLNIVTKHTEIATASQGGTASPSPDAELSSAGANAGGEDVDRSAERANINAVASASGPDEKRASNSPEEATEVLHPLEPTRGEDAAMASSQHTRSHAQAAGRYPESRTDGTDNRDSGERPAPSFIGKPKYVLRPNCRNPEACGGYGANHCHPCQKAMREKAEEVA